jgi:hypothetical protein
MRSFSSSSGPTAAAARSDGRLQNRAGSRYHPDCITALVRSTEGRHMAKSQDTKKDKKKAPQKTPKEKKQAKREKKGK